MNKKTIEFDKYRYLATQEEARQYAIDFQQWVSEQSLSYGELAEWSDRFTKIAEKFDLVEEFEENGII
jgi:hypothetical protein